MDPLLALFGLTTIGAIAGGYILGHAQARRRQSAITVEALPARPADSGGQPRPGFILTFRGHQDPAAVARQLRHAMAKTEALSEVRQP